MTPLVTKRLIKSQTLKSLVVLTICPIIQMPIIGLIGAMTAAEASALSADPLPDGDA